MLGIPSDDDVKAEEPDADSTADGDDGSDQQQLNKKET